MKLLAIIFLETLWLLSIFSFAQWRIAATADKRRPGSVSNDLIFQLYLKISGVIVLGWIGFLLYKGG